MYAYEKINKILQIINIVLYALYLISINAIKNEWLQLLSTMAPLGLPLLPLEPT